MKTVTSMWISLQATGASILSFGVLLAPPVWSAAERRWFDNPTCNHFMLHVRDDATNWAPVWDIIAPTHRALFWQA